MSTAFLHGASAAPGIPYLELERVTADWLIASEKVITPDHDGKCVYVILSGTNYDGYVEGEFYIDGVRVENTDYDFVVRRGAPSPCGALFILCVKHGSAYDLCRLDGTVVRAQAADFKIRNFSHGLYVAILKAAE